jgi:hypothetical protein
MFRFNLLAGALTKFSAIWCFPLGKATKKSEGLVRIFKIGVRVLLLLYLWVIAISYSLIMG